MPFNELVRYNSQVKTVLQSKTDCPFQTEQIEKKKIDPEELHGLTDICHKTPAATDVCRNQYKQTRTLYTFTTSEFNTNIPSQKLFDCKTNCLSAFKARRLTVATILEKNVLLNH